MTQEQPQQQPITYGDVFPVVREVASQPITGEDASLMQSAESIALGHTQKGGAASMMQSAANQNVRAGVLQHETHTAVAEQGVTVMETAVPGKVVRAEFVAGQPVIAETRPLPRIPNIPITEGVTIGEALEVAALGAGDKPIESSDARAIQSAETRATGNSVTKKGGLAATAQSAAELNPRVDSFAKTTLADVLTDATIDLALDKLATRSDAAKVIEAETRNREDGKPRPGGVAAALQGAADLNELAGTLFATSELPLESTTVGMEEEAAMTARVNVEAPMKSVASCDTSQDELSKQMDCLQVEKPE